MNAHCSKIYTLWKGQHQLTTSYCFYHSSLFLSPPAEMAVPYSTMGKDKTPIRMSAFTNMHQFAFFFLYKNV
jgi:hypothetical protein